MRIAMISEHASPLAAIGGIDSGGQNVYVWQVARHLVQAGHRVDVFTRRDAEEQPTVVQVQPDLKMVHVSAGPHAFVPKEKLLDFMPQFARFCEQWIRTAPAYDVIHANFFMSGWVGLRLKDRFGLPLVTTFHALGLVRKLHQAEADGFPAARDDIERQLVVRSERIVAECPQDQHDLQSLYDADPARVAMVPCGFDCEELHPLERRLARARLGIPADEFMVLQLGRMVPRKGIDTVVRAMAHDRCAHMRLRVVGGDCEVPDPLRSPEIGRLQAIAREGGVSERVIFAGRKPRSELRDWYSACDVFVTTPWYEPFGITPLEAMACARPVIGSDVGGIRYSVVAGSTGLLVPPKDPGALADALGALSDDPARAAEMGRNGRSRVEREFTWEKVAFALHGVFAAAIADCRSSRAAQPSRSMLQLADAPLPARPASDLRPSRPAIFLDKDGTLVRDVPFNVDPALLSFTPHALQALRLWRDAGYRLVVITNQPGIGQGLFDRADLSILHRALAARLATAGVPLDGMFACPHPQDAGCACRKPGDLLLRQAAWVLRIDLERSWMVGDILNDVEAGHRAGCRSILLDVGNETEWLPGPLREPEFRCPDLLQAAAVTLSAQVRTASMEPVLSGAVR